MEVWQIVACILGPALAIFGMICGYLKWRDISVASRATHRQISEQNQTLIQNHLTHHEGTLEPWMREISTTVGYIKGKLDRKFPE